MKKIFLILGLFVFSCLSVNATTVSVHYNNAGSPVSVSYGYYKPISMMRAQQYGAQYHNMHHPRMHRPRTYVGYRYNDGYVGPYVGMQESISEGHVGVTHTVNAQKNISTLSKNYKKITPAKTHTAGGLTYYY